MTELQARFRAMTLNGASQTSKLSKGFRYTPKFKGGWCIEVTNGAQLLRTLYATDFVRA